MSSYEKEINNIFKKAGIEVDSDRIEDVKKIYVQISMDTLNNLNKITLHRSGNKIELGDVFLLKNLLNDRMMGGGDYINQLAGSLDMSPSPASVSPEYVNMKPEVKNLPTLTGGITNDLCAGHPTQCRAELLTQTQQGFTTQTGGFREYIKSLKKINEENIVGFLNIDKHGRYYSKGGASLSEDTFDQIINNTLAFDISEQAKKPLQAIIENEVVNQLNNYYTNQENTENQSTESSENDSQNIMEGGSSKSIENYQQEGGVDILSQINNLKSNFMKQLEKLRNIEDNEQSGGYSLSNSSLYNDILSMKQSIHNNINNLNQMKNQHEYSNQTGGAFSHIVDPKTKRKIPVRSLLGETIINMYKNYLS